MRQAHPAPGLGGRRASGAGRLGDRRTLWTSISAVAVAVVALIASPAPELLLAAAFAFGFSGAVSDALGLTAGLGLYAAVPLLILALLALLRGSPR